MKKIGYIPFSKDNFNPSFDARNILLYSKLNKTKIINYYEEKNFEILVLPPSYDPTNTNIFKQRDYKIVYHIVDDYLSYSDFSFKNIFRGVFYYLIGRSSKMTFNYKKNQINLCKLSDAIICASEEQRKKIEKYNKNCFVFFEGHFRVSKAEVIKQKSKTFKIVWEGRSENIFHLNIIKNAFRKLVKKYNIELHIVTDFTYPLFYKSLYLSTIKEIKKIFGNLYQENIIKKKSSVYLHQWNIELVSTILKSCDIAIIPLNKKDTLANGKSINKFIHMLRNNLPTVATDIESYKNIYNSLGFDYSCKDGKDWHDNIVKLIENPELLKNFNEKSFKYIERNFSENKFIEQWDNLFDTL